MAVNAILERKGKETSANIMQGEFDSNTNFSEHLFVIFHFITTHIPYSIP